MADRKTTAKVPRGGKTKGPAAERDPDYVRPNDTGTGTDTTRSSER